MTCQAKCLARRVYLMIMKSRNEANTAAKLTTKYKPCTFIRQRFSIIKQQNCGREWLVLLVLSIKRNLAVAQSFVTMEHMMHTDSYKTKFDVFSLME